MTTPHADSAAIRDYAIAHAMHYGGNDLTGALAAYSDLILAYPDAPEAEYSRAQIRNIANRVVPAGQLLDAARALAAHHLQPDSDGSAGPTNP